MRRKIPSNTKSPADNQNKKVDSKMKELPDPQLIKLSMPFFGGTVPTPVPTSATPATSATPTTGSPAAVIVTPATTQPSTTDATSGGSQTSEDPLAKLAADPNALGQLLSQVEKLTRDLKIANDKVVGFETKAAEETRKQQTREQQLEADLAQREATIQQMDGVIRSMAISNAILNNKDIQWHSLKQVTAELNPEAFDISVDLEHGTATVTGVDNEVKRIAKDCPWLVAKNNATPPPANPRTPRSSGIPPAPPASDASKQSSRTELMKRFPVIAHGR